MIILSSCIRSCGLFDFFPEGNYQVEGEDLISDSDIIAPKGKFYAPFEHALLK